MAIVDRTLDFRQTLEENQPLASSKRRKIAAVTSGTSPVQPNKEFVAEAYLVLDHIDTLSRMLMTIRKPYLNLDSRTVPLSRQGSRSMDLGVLDQTWSEIRYLTNEERDQIDMQARVILSRCADRVKDMEAHEKRRAELVASKLHPLTKWLPARLTRDESTISSDFIAAHHSSMTWYLNRRLAETSQSQKEMQEERFKRQLERTRSLGSVAPREALEMSLGKPEDDKKSWLRGASSTLASSFVSRIGTTSQRESSQVASKPADSGQVSDEDDDEIELSQSQILQFETENANILRSVQDTLESVQLAESRLLEISALQMELVTHLTRQTELTEQLYEDAIATTATVEKGNVQLREAKRRAKDGRIYILAFLVGASLSLLFLHYY